MNLNLFFVPSWYPNPKDYLAGIFCQEQVYAIARERPNWNIFVSLWGQTRAYTMPLLHMERWPKVLLPYLREKRLSSHYVKRNLVELHRPLLSWSRRVMSEGWEFERILSANRANLREALRIARRIDVIHAHVVDPGGVIAAQLSREFSIPYVITEHTGLFPTPYHLEQGQLKSVFFEAFMSAKATLGVSPAQVERLRGCGLSNVCLVPNLVDERKFTFKPGRTSGSGCCFFTLTSTLSREKGIDDLLQAIHRLDDKKVFFRMGGPADEGSRNYYASMAERLGISAQLTWLGPLTRDEAIREMQACDCFVLPSRHESFGMVYAEALFCGKPVIATRCGGPEWIVKPHQGLLVEVEHCEQLAEALGTMSKRFPDYDPEAIRSDALDRFSSGVIVSHLEGVYTRRGL